MKTRIVKLIYRYKPNKNLIKVSISKIPISKACFTIYDTVDLFLRNIFLKSKFKTSFKPVTNKILLGDIINLHNDTGVKDISKINSMTNQIISGKDVYNTNGLPNIRLVKTKDSHWVLFDGHHTMLAYMFAGRKYLHETPHLIVEGGITEYASDKEINIFFGEHKSKLKNDDWRKYVINWQAQKEKQLCNRIQKNMKELFESLSKKFLSLN